MSDIELRIDDEARQILESRGIRQEDVLSVVRHAEESGQKLYSDDRYLAKLVMGEVTFYAEYSAAAPGVFTVHTAYCHRARLED